MKIKYILKQSQVIKFESEYNSKYWNEAEFAFNTNYIIKYKFDYGVRVNISESAEYLDDCIYVPDSFILSRTDYLISEKIESEYYKNRNNYIKWDEIDIKNYYIIYLIDGSYIGYSENFMKEFCDEYDFELYKDWVIKRLLE